MSKLTVYYAHSLHLYGTPQEQRDIELLESLGFVVVNPNQEKHQHGCRKEKAEGGTGMWYFRALVEACDVVAFRALPDGSIGAGVRTEVMDYGKGKPIIELPSRLTQRGLDLVQTREMLRECGER